MGRHLYDELLHHLLPPRSKFEEAAFVFSTATQEAKALTFEPVDRWLISPDDFVIRSPYFLELKDEVRAQMIKHAHQLSTSVIELHSHPGYRAEFSVSDKLGLREFVPHVRWRLKKKPYCAIVVAPGALDALVWTDDSGFPTALDRVEVDGQYVRPTGWSLSNWEVLEDEQSIRPK
jgi:hypothetical protein